MLLDWEPAIVERLEAAGLRVLTAPNLASIDRQITPAVHLVYGGYAAAEAGLAGSRVDVTWLAVVAVRNARSHASGADSRNEAAAPVTDVITALNGWRVPGAHTPLRMSTAPRVEFDAGFYAVPMAFTASATLYPKCEVAA